MPRDECSDCEAHFPGGEGLTEGRCRGCRTAFLARQRKEATKGPAKAAKKAEEK